MMTMHRGFSLIQLSAIVLAAGLVAAAVIPEGGGDSRAQRYLTTIKRMEKIEQASVKMMAVEGRRPCPASGEYYPGHANFAKEDGTAGDCVDSGSTNGILTPFNDTNVVGGTVPTTTLGLSQDDYFDGWGRPFTYAVDKRATDALECVQIAGPGDVKIYNSDGGTQIDQTMYTLISHGPDGHGSFQSGGSTRTNRFDSTSTDADQRNNAGASGVANFSTTPYKNEWIKKETTSTYDDLTWYSEKYKNTCCVGKECGESLALLAPPESPELDFTGFRADGANAGDGAGYDVTNGDVNGDGIDDVILSAPNANGSSGYVYVIFGKATGIDTPLDLTTLDGTNGFRLDGAVTYAVGTASSGDINNDGFSDVIIGAPNNAGGSAIYVVFGKASGWAATTLLSSLNGTTGFKLNDTLASFPGVAVSSGDINNDGFDDVVVGAGGANNSWRGYVYVVFGKASGWTATVDLAGLNGTTGFRLDGTSNNDQAGSSVATGDINHDNYDDLIIGAWRVNSNAGSTYVVFGKSGVWSASSALSGLNGTTGFRLDAAGAGDLFGSALASGDINNDGFDDVIASALYADPDDSWETNGAGAVYVIFGKANGWAATMGVSTLNGTNGFRLSGRGWPTYESGHDLSSGDINGDGITDVVIGNWNGCESRGSTITVFGKSSGWSASTWLKTLTSTEGFMLQGMEGEDSTGIATAVGDITGDGIGDILVGRYQADNNSRNDSGSVYGVYGSTAAWSEIYAIDELTLPGSSASPAPCEPEGGGGG